MSDREPPSGEVRWWVWVLIVFAVAAIAFLFYLAWIAAVILAVPIAILTFYFWPHIVERLFSGTPDKKHESEE